MIKEVLRQKSWLEEIRQNALPIAVYGMGNGADKLFSFLEQQELSPSCVFASDAFVRGQQFRGYPVLTFDQAVARYGRVNVLLAFATDLPEVMERIQSIGRKMPLFCPSFSVTSGDCATRAFLAAHEAQIEQAYESLADDASRAVFRAVAAFQLTGCIRLLDAVSIPRQRSLELLELGPQEIYADLGAFRGDTLQEFLEQVDGSYRQIFAVEPDAKNFAKLKRFAAERGLKRLVLKNVAAYGSACELTFGSPGGRSSSIGRGNGSVQALPLMEITEGQIPTYLKMDIEGAEASALWGMREVLASHAPKLLVSAYHKIEDYFALPLQILEMQPSYRVYLCKSPYYAAWEVNLLCKR